MEVVEARVIGGALRWSVREGARGYHIGVTCPRCGEPCEPVTEGRVIQYQGAGSETRAVFACTECSPRREFVIAAFVRAISTTGRDQSGRDRKLVDA